MKSTKAEIARRVEFCLRLRLQGAEIWDIREIVGKDGEPWPNGHGKAWRVADSTIYRYLQLADELLSVTLEKRRNVCLDRHIATRRMLYNRALTTNDYRTALSILDSEAKLLDIVPAEKHNVGGPDGGPIPLCILETIVDAPSPAADG